jgi:hypothetical protein
MAYVRFVIPSKDEDSGRRQGLFQALSGMVDQGILLPYQEHLWDETRKWFNKHLEEPTSFARSSRPHAKDVALSWFRDSAVEHIHRMRILVHLLDEHGVACEVVRTERPGYVVYEDAFQVIAVPFTDTTT